MHDLVRLYADEHAHTDPSQRDRAQTRLFEHYRTSTRAADTHLLSPPTAVSPRFHDRAAAVAWLGDERANLVATCTTAPDVGHADISIDLAFDLARFLDFRRFFDDWITTTTTALNILRETGDRHGEGRALGNLGLALWEVLRFDEARSNWKTAVEAFTDSRDDEAAALIRQWLDDLAPPDTP